MTSPHLETIASYLHASPFCSLDVRVALIKTVQFENDSFGKNSFLNRNKKGVLYLKLFLFGNRCRAMKLCFVFESVERINLKVALY